jgi:hypothetical protein
MRSWKARAALFGVTAAVALASPTAHAWNSMCAWPMTNADPVKEIPTYVQCEAFDAHGYDHQSVLAAVRTIQAFWNTQSHIQARLADPVCAGAQQWSTPGGILWTFVPFVVITAFEEINDEFVWQVGSHPESTFGFAEPSFDPAVRECTSALIQYASTVINALGGSGYGQLRGSAVSPIGLHELTHAMGLLHPQESAALLEASFFGQLSPGLGDYLWCNGTEEDNQCESENMLSAKSLMYGDTNTNTLWGDEVYGLRGMGALVPGDPPDPPPCTYLPAVVDGAIEVLEYDALATGGPSFTLVDSIVPGSNATPAIACGGEGLVLAFLNEDAEVVVYEQGGQGFELAGPIPEPRAAVAAPQLAYGDNRYLLAYPLLDPFGDEGAVRLVERRVAVGGGGLDGGVDGGASGGWDHVATLNVEAARRVGLTWVEEGQIWLLAYFQGDFRTGSVGLAYKKAIDWHQDPGEWRTLEIDLEDAGFPSLQALVTGIDVACRSGEEDHAICWIVMADGAAAPHPIREIVIDIDFSGEPEATLVRSFVYSPSAGSGSIAYRIHTHHDVSAAHHPDWGQILIGFQGVDGAKSALVAGLDDALTFPPPGFDVVGGAFPAGFAEIQPGLSDVYAGVALTVDPVGWCGAAGLAYVAAHRRGGQ